VARRMRARALVLAELVVDDEPPAPVVGARDLRRRHHRVQRGAEAEDAVGVHAQLAQAAWESGHAGATRQVPGFALHTAANEPELATRNLQSSCTKESNGTN
jgi:hypothetical protein